MGTPINQELRELRMVKEHYKRILSDDAKLKESGEIEGARLLNDEDIAKINTKLDAVDERITGLLSETNDYMV